MKSFKFLLILLLGIYIFLFLSVEKIHADYNLFDNFNGEGDLSEYNHLYKHVSNIYTDGKFILDTDHLIASGLDPFYIYTGIEVENGCASIDFNWQGEAKWTGILINSTLSNWNNELQIDGRSDSWHFYYNDGLSETSGPVKIELNQNHTLKACINKNKISGYIDDNIFLEGHEISQGKGFFGFGTQLGTNFIDNFSIELIPESSINLNVPLLKQTSKPWKNQIYDSALLWNPKDPSIGSWGCALTSAAMVFNFHGISKLPNGTNLDPGTLNSWLKSQKDGYIGNGAVNWLALSRLSKLAKNVNSLNYDALEYKRINGNASNELSSSLNNNLPGILAEPGHFIVAKGITDGIFSINDPYYSRNTLTDYGNSFQNLGIYTPSNTDLSYIMLTVEKNINIQLLDSNNNLLGEIFEEGEIINPNNQNQKTENFKIVYLQKPADGIYSVILNSNSKSSFNLNIYEYNKFGDVFINSKSGTVSKDENKNISFEYSGQADFYNKKVTFLSTAIDIEKFRAKKLITNEATKFYLEELLAKAFTANLAKNDELKQKYFSAFIEFLGKTNKVIDPANSILLYDINYLSSHP